MAKTEPEFAVVVVTVPKADGELTDLPLTVTTHVGDTVTEDESVLVMADGVDWGACQEAGLNAHTRITPGSKLGDPDNLEALTPNGHVPAFQHAILRALQAATHCEFLWYPDDYERACISNLPGYQATESDPWGTAPWELVESVLDNSRTPRILQLYKRLSED